MAMRGGTFFCVLRVARIIALRFPAPPFLLRQPVKPARHLFQTPMPPHQPTPPNTRQPSKADKELLFKGVTCALIGLVIVLAPYIARSGDVRELMGQVAAVGWFALVLGGAFIVQYVVRRVRAGAHRQ